MKRVFIYIKRAVPKRLAGQTENGRQLRKPFFRSRRGILLIIVLLVAIGSPLYLYLGQAAADTATMVPDSDVTTGWSPSSGTSHYSLVADGTTDNTSNYVQVLSSNSTASVTDQYTLNSPSGILSASQVVVRIYMQATTNANGGIMDTISLNLIVNGTAQTATTCTPVYNSWTACTATYSGSWVQTDVDSMQVSIVRNIQGSGKPSAQPDTVQVANVYGTLTYVPSLKVTQASYRLFQNQDAAYNGFAGKVDYATGSGSRSVVTGDFNGDGKTDLATANNSSSTVSVLLGNGDGTFQPKTDYTTGTNPYSFATGDFNGDGKLDLAVANSGNGSGNTVSILLGNGDGTFQPKVDYTTGTGPYSVATGDFNGDGKIDLAVANSYNGTGGNTVSILLGNGDGTFQPKTDYATGTAPVSITNGDFNGDGKIDLVTANYGSNTVSILLGNGNGTFQTKTDYATGTSPDSVVTGDFNGDGKIDLAVTNSINGTGGNTVSVLLGNGDGTFQPKTDYTTGTGPYSVATGDFNGDGKLDLAVANQSSNTVSILLGNGDGTFQPKTDYTTGTGPYSVTAGDFNGDGKLDLAVTNYIGATVSILLNQSTAVNVGSPLAAQNTAATTPGDGQPFALRMDVGMTGSTVNANAGSYKLQYAPMTTSCDTGFTNTPASAYQDVTDTSAVRYYNNVHATNGAPLTSNANDPTDGTNPLVYESYQGKGTTSFTNPNAIPAGSDGLWDFALTTYHTLQNTSFCLRVVNSSGAQLDNYTTIPQINMPAATFTQASYRWFESNTTGTSMGTPITFSYTGAAQSYVVPGGVTSVQIETWGAQGGSVGGGGGGLGGYAKATIPTTPGETLQVNVGGSPGSSPFGGFNGGGTDTSYTDGGGGGASDVRQGGTALSNRVVIAGGGGGDIDISGSDPGGSGGGLNGGDVASCSTGGSQTAGGTGGGGNGDLGAGSPTYGGGAGGGGYYGGGAGNQCAGAGGSGYVSGTNTSMSNGVQSGNGKVVITPNVISVGAPVGDQNVIADLRYTGVSIRLRVDIGVSGSGVANGGQSFKLQYALKSTSCSAASFSDVTATSPIQWYNDANLTDGSAIGSSAYDPTDTPNTIVPQTYEESNPFANASILYGGEDGMWDFNLIMPSGSTMPGTDVCLRVVKSDGTAFTASSYLYYPELQYGPKMSELMRTGGWFDQNGKRQPYFTGQ